MKILATAVRRPAALANIGREAAKPALHFSLPHLKTGAIHRLAIKFAVAKPGKRF